MRTEVRDPRSIRRHDAGVADFEQKLHGARLDDVVRRGKFLWLPLVRAGELSPSHALVAHLGMSGQLLIQDDAVPDEKHLKVRLRLSPGSGADGSRLPAELRFVDQRIFGGLFIAPLKPTADGGAGGYGAALPVIPASAWHIARDPLDPEFSFDGFFARLRTRRTGIKRALLDQGLVSGIGNIYADEALWSARLHFARPTDTLRRPEAGRLLEAAREVMRQALEAGGTSFDSLYVNVNGTSGYFARSLRAYGREGMPCERCCGEQIESFIRRDAFMGRSSYTCPRCQPRPRNARW